MHAGPLSLVQSSHFGVVAGPDRTQRSSRSMVSTRARGTTRHLFRIHAATTRRRWPNTRGHTAADRRRRLGVCLWPCPLVTGIFSSHPLPLLRRAGARSPVAVRDDVPAAAAAVAAGNAECGISLHSRVRQAGSPVNHRLATAAIGSRFCACVRIRSDFCIVGISFVRV